LQSLSPTGSGKQPMKAEARYTACVAVRCIKALISQPDLHPVMQGPAVQRLA
jgi:hypothetical protein